MSLLLRQGLNFVLPFIVSIVFIRQFTMGEFGFYIYLQSIAVYFQGLVVYGFNLVGTSDISKAANENNSYDEIISDVIYSRILLGIISFLFLGVIVLIDSEIQSNAGLFFCTTISIIGFIFNLDWFFHGVQDLLKVTIVAGLIRLALSLLAIFCSIYYNSLIFGAFLLSLSGVISSFYSIYLARKRYKIKLRKINFGHIYTYLGKALPVYISMVGVLLYSSINYVFLKKILDSVAVGYFVSAERILQLFIGVFGPISAAFFPKFVNLFSENKKLLYPYFTKLLYFYYAVAIFIAIFIYSLAEQLIIITSNQKLDQSIISLKILAFAVIPGVTGSLFTYYLMVFDRRNDLLKATLTASIVNLTLVYPLIKYFGVSGMAILILINYSVVTLTYGFFIRKVNKENLY